MYYIFVISGTLSGSFSMWSVSPCWGLFCYNNLHIILYLHLFFVLFVGISPTVAGFPKWALIQITLHPLTLRIMRAW